MSLPSQVIFFKGEEQVAKVFINVGWVFDERSLPINICEAVNEHRKLARDPEYADRYEDINFAELDYDSIVAYEKVFTRENFHKWCTQQITLDELLETVEDYVWPEEAHKRRKRKYRKRIGLED